MIHTPLECFFWTSGLQTLPKSGVMRKKNITSKGSTHLHECVQEPRKKICVCRIGFEARFHGVKIVSYRIKNKESNYHTYGCLVNKKGRVSPASLYTSLASALRMVMVIASAPSVKSAMSVSPA